VAGILSFTKLAGGFLGTDDSFARLVSLACHDLRTPLATVSGFAHTLENLEEPGPPADRYVEMILAGAEQMAELLEELALVSRIEDGRYEPHLIDGDTRVLVDTAAARLGERGAASGEGAGVRIDREPTERALAALALCAARHGGVDTVELRAEGAGIAISPVTEEAAPVVLGQELKDLGAIVAVRFIHAVGGSLELDGETLRVRLSNDPGAS
jgi:signal transduction histidine kinase